jgi:ribosomal protein L32E
MVTKAVRRTLSGLTSAFAPAPKRKRGAAHTRADEAWRRTHGLHSTHARKDPKA